MNLDWDKFLDLMCCLGFVAELPANNSMEYALLCQVWLQLEAETRGGVSVMNARYFCKGILGLLKDIKQDLQTLKHQPVTTGLGYFNRAGEYQFNEGQLRNVFGKFKLLFSNRMHFLGKQRS